MKEPYVDIRTEREEEKMVENAKVCEKKCNNIDPLLTQVGGDHYKDFIIQPIEFITKNKLGFIQGCIIKRICRYNKKGGKGKEDLLKIKHEIDILIDLEVI